MRKIGYSEWLATRRMLWVYLIGSILIGTSPSSGMDNAKDKPSEGIKRDPFWPVGYVPEFAVPEITDVETQVVQSQESSWDEAMKKVVINGVSSRADNQFCAVINGRLTAVNDTVSINHEGTIYTWAVDSIAAPGSVKLRRVSSGVKR